MRVWTKSLDHRCLFVVRRLQEVWWEAGLSLLTCFSDLHTAYDTDDRTLLWQVFARMVVPQQQMIAVIRPFREDMIAYE